MLLKAAELSRAEKASLPDAINLADLLLSEQSLGQEGGTLGGDGNADVEQQRRLSPESLPPEKSAEPHTDQLDQLGQERGDRLAREAGSIVAEAAQQPREGLVDHRPQHERH